MGQKDNEKEGSNLPNSSLVPQAPWTVVSISSVILEEVQVLVKVFLEKDAPCQSPFGDSMEMGPEDQIREREKIPEAHLVGEEKREVGCNQPTLLASTASTPPPQTPPSEIPLGLGQGHQESQRYCLPKTRPFQVLSWQVGRNKEILLAQGCQEGEGEVCVEVGQGH